MATVTWLQGRSWMADGDRDQYESRMPLNHVSVIAAGVGAGVAVTGLVMTLSGARRSDEPSPLSFSITPDAACVCANWTR